VARGCVSLRDVLLTLVLIDAAACDTVLEPCYLGLVVVSMFLTDCGRVVGAVPKMRRTLAGVRDHPYNRVTLS